MINSEEKELVKRLLRWVGWGILLAFVMIDLLTIKFGWLGVYGISVWIMTSLVFAGVGGYAFLRIGHESIKNRSAWFLLSFLLVFGVLCWQAFNSANLSGEATQEIACLLKHMAKAVDGGMRQTCLFGYPARQYVPQALPSLFFGRSLAALQLGTAWQLGVSMLIFGMGLMSIPGNNWSKRDMVAGLAIIALLHFRFFNYLAFNYEQSIYPFIWSSVGVGGWLMAYYRKSWMGIWLVIFAGMMVTASYTPGLALVPICVLGIVVLWWKFKSKWLWLLAGLFCVVVNLISVWLFRDDLNPGSMEIKVAKDILSELLEAIKFLFVHQDSKAFISPSFLGLWWVSWGWCLVGLKKMVSGLIQAWFFLIAILAVLMKGYTAYSVDFKLHRLMLAVPVLLGLIGWNLIKNRDVRRGRIWLLLWLYLLITGGYYLWKNVGERNPHSHVTAINMIQNLLPDYSITKLWQSEAFGKLNNLVSLKDTMTYFLPNITITSELNSPGFDKCELVFLSEYVLLATIESCPTNNKYRLEKIASITLKDGEGVLYRKLVND